MALPCFKYIQLNSADKRFVYSQLNTLRFHESPTVLIIEELAKNQVLAIESIESYVTEYNIDVLPYGIYVISSIKDYQGDLTIVSDRNLLPFHFKQKHKSLNSRENRVLKKVNLKRQNFESLKSADYKEIIKDYSIPHKRIAQLQSESEFLDSINQALEK